MENYLKHGYYGYRLEIWLAIVLTARFSIVGPAIHVTTGAQVTVDAQAAPHEFQWWPEKFE